MTYRQLVAAMRKNGYTKGKNNFILYAMPDGAWQASFILHKDVEIIAACAIGQAAINLEIDPSELIRRMNWDIKMRIYELNDSTDLTVPQIADKIEKEFSGMMNILL